jgi:hypothetical protein
VTAAAPLVTPAPVTFPWPPALAVLSDEPVCFCNQRMAFLTALACSFLLTRSQCATGRLKTCLRIFPLSSRECWNGSQFRSFYCVLFMQLSRLKFIKIKPLDLKATKSSLIITHVAVNQKLNTPWPQTTTVHQTYHLTWINEYFPWTPVRSSSSRGRKSQVVKAVGISVTLSVSWGTTLQAGRSRVPFLMKSAALWPWGWLSL